MDTKVTDKLVNKAREFSQSAYCPYSEVPIGACVLTQNGLLFGGCNIETASLSGSLGAVEVALCKAVSEGYTQITTVAIFSEKIMPFPTGNERQLIREFSNRAQVICANNEKIEELNIQELLPFARDTVDV